jgi:hypothetical protein
MNMRAILIWGAVILFGLLWWMRRSANQRSKR